VAEVEIKKVSGQREGGLGLPRRYTVEVTVTVTNTRTDSVPEAINEVVARLTPESDA
jgi:hypothetical protein